MTDYRKFLEKEFLYEYDLEGRDFTLTIAKVEGGELTGEGGKTTKKPIVTFVGAKKKLALNATNGATIAGMYGCHVEEWIGKKITLFPSVTNFGKQKNLPCIRIRPTVPTEKAAPAAREPGEEG